MPSFCAADGTELAYHVQGAPLVCLPGGPGRASSYLGDLGGLSAHRRLILLDSRGTGRSAIPADPASYRCDHLVEDVAALQDHLRLDRVDLLGHSAGANVAVQYAARQRERVGKLVLITAGWPDSRQGGAPVGQYQSGYQRPTRGQSRPPWETETSVQPICLPQQDWPENNRQPRRRNSDDFGYPEQR